MKKHSLILFLVLQSALAIAFPARINSWNVDRELKTLNAHNINVDNVNRATGPIVVYLRDDSEMALLLDEGFSAEKLPDLARENAARLHQNSSKDAPKDDYYTITQYNQFMLDTAAQYPNICSLSQIGTSVQGRPLYFMKITDNPSLEEAEPEFKFISSIHGDEVVGYDMCIRLIQLLTSEYGNNTRITNLVNNTEISRSANGIVASPRAPALSCLPQSIRRRWSGRVRSPGIFPESAGWPASAGGGRRPSRN